MYHFAAPPPALVLYAPFTIVPEAFFANGMIVASIAAAVCIVRRLRLAWWWLLFPPLLLGVGSANPGIILLALLLWGHPVAEAVAAGLKVYAVVPMFTERRWRGLAVSLIAAAITVIAFSSLWAAYVEQSPAITRRLVVELKGGEGATAYWWLVPPTVVAVAFIAWRDLRAAGWLVVPALWPSGQFHYAVMALPVIRLLPAAAFAMPVKGMPAVAVILHAWLLLRDDVIARRRNRDRVDQGQANDP
jgi:hypothetical protein